MKRKNKQKTILLLLMGWLAIVLASFSMMFYEIHIHQQQTINKLNVEMRAYMQERGAFDKAQRESLASIAKQQQILVQDWQQTLQEISRYKKLMQDKIVMNQPEAVSYDAAVMPDVSTLPGEDKPKPVRPHR